MKKIILIAALSIFYGAFTTAQASETVNLSSLKEFANAEKKESFKKGDKGLVYFWAEWCPDCKATLKSKKMLEFHLRKDISIFPINKDRNLKKAKHFLKKYDVNKFPIYTDPDKKISKALKAFSVPHWAVLENIGDHNWKVLKIGSGNISPAVELLNAKK